MSKVYRCEVELVSADGRRRVRPVYASGGDRDEARAVASQALHDNALLGDGHPSLAYEVTGLTEVPGREVPTSEVVYHPDILPTPKP